MLRNGESQKEKERQSMQEVQNPKPRHQPERISKNELNLMISDFIASCITTFLKIVFIFYLNISDCK